MKLFTILFSLMSLSAFATPQPRIEIDVYSCSSNTNTIVHTVDIRMNLATQTYVAEVNSYCLVCAVEEFSQPKYYDVLPFNDGQYYGYYSTDGEMSLVFEFENTNEDITSFLNIGNHQSEEVTCVPYQAHRSH